MTFTMSLEPARTTKSPRQGEMGGAGGEVRVSMKKSGHFLSSVITLYER